MFLLVLFFDLVITVVLSTYLRLQTALPLVYIRAALRFCHLRTVLIFSPQRLKNIGDKNQPCQTPFSRKNLSMYYPFSALTTAVALSYKAFLSATRCFGVTNSLTTEHHPSQYNFSAAYIVQIFLVPTIRRRVRHVIRHEPPCRIMGPYRHRGFDPPNAPV